MTRRGRLGSITDDGEICKHFLCFLLQDRSATAYMLSLLCVLLPAAGRVFSHSSEFHKLIFMFMPHAE